MNGDFSAGLLARVALESNLFRYNHNIGQNFLLDDELIERIISCAGVDENSNILEVGPGAGVMTRHMADRGASVTAVELDKNLEPVLETVLDGSNVRLIWADIMKLDIETTMGEKPYFVVANLPYYITGDVILRFLSLKNRPERIDIMVQTEAAERIMAKQGSKKWCALSATVQYFCKCETLEELGPELFTPSPHVSSSFIELECYAEKPVQAKDDRLMVRLINCAFAMRRKTMQNNLCASFSVDRDTAEKWLTACGLDPKVRGEALSLAELCALADVIFDAKQ